MAITAGNAVYSGQAPSFSAQQLAQNLGGPDSQKFYGTATVTGDASSTTFNVNFVDGTQTLNFTPTGILVQRTGGAATATITVTNVTALTSTLFTVSTSAAVNAATFTVSFVAWK